MNFTFTDEQQTLAQMARRFLERNAGGERARKLSSDATGYDPAVWRRVADELGWPAMIIPERFGGFGLGYVELAATLEQTGYFLACSPMFATVCLGANALLLLGNDEQKARFLPDIASGATTATLALAEEGSGQDVSARADGDGFVLDGVKRCVLDGHSADLVLVVAGDAVFAIPGDCDGLRRTRHSTMDTSRPQAELIFESVRVSAATRLGGAPSVAAGLDRVVELAAIALAAEQVGGAQACLDLSVDYAKVRKQFGRAIGSFQAIKHMCADMLVQVESARSAAYYAAWAASAGSEDLSEAAAIAKAFCSDAYYRCAADTIQIHGGIGFTWEHDAHLYFKRARADQALLGPPRAYRERVAETLGL